MRLLVVLLAFVCAFEAAKFKFHVEQTTRGDYGKVVFAVHDFTTELISTGAPSKGLNTYITSGGTDTDAFLAELTLTKGVREAATAQWPAGAAATWFYAQALASTDRVTVFIVSSTGADLYVADGVRLPTDVVTAYPNFNAWHVSGVLELTGPSPDLYLSGIQICPYNDRVVYAKLEITDGAKYNKLDAPVFWTQAGGSNAVWSASPEAVADLASGERDSFIEAALWNMDVCTVVDASALQSDGTGVYEVPVAVGQKVFFAVGATASDATTVVFSTDNNGWNVWVDGAIPSHVDVSDQVVAYQSVQNTDGSYSIAVVTEESSSLSAFYFDHFPTGQEFPEVEFALESEYPIGICGSWKQTSEGAWEATQWKQHPYDCTDQLGGDKCMYCKGRANNEISMLCLERMGNTCNGAFNSIPREMFCNLEFECPASAISFSMILAFALLVLVFLAF